MKSSILILIGFIIALLFSGCAQITPVYDSKGNIIEVKSVKFLADLEYGEHYKYDKDGNIIEKEIKYATKTNADRILGEVNKAVGTAVGVARDMMP